MDDRKQSAQIQIEHKYANNVTLSLSQPDLNNIVADEEVDDAYTDTLMTALGTKQPSIAWDSRRRIVEFEVLANALASCTNSSNCHMRLPQDHTVMHFKGKLKHFYNYDSHSINAVLCCNIQYDI